MGKNLREVQKMHKLRDDVLDNVPKREAIDKKDEILHDSPGAYAAIRGLKHRFAGDFGADTFQPKLEVSWRADVDLERIDFGGGDYGIRVTLPFSAKELSAGVIDLDEFRILEEGSELESQRFEFITEANVGDVAAGKIRIIDETTWRLPDEGNVSAKAAIGDITLDSTLTDADLVDTETFTLDDGVNPATVFEFDDGLGGGVTPGNVAITFSPGDDATTIRDAILAAINGVGAGLAITASPQGVTDPSIRLVNDTPGVAGNVAIVDTVTTPKFSASGMASGADAANIWVDELGVRIRIEIGAGVR
jgi:hypothetical protein